MSRTPSEKRFGIVTRCCASRSACVAAIENGADIAPVFRRLLLDVRGDRPVEQQREQERGRDGLARRHALIGVGEARDQQLFDQAAGMPREVTSPRPDTARASRPRRRSTSSDCTPWPVRNSFRVSSNRRAAGTSRSRSPQLLDGRFGVPDPA